MAGRHGACASPGGGISGWGGGAGRASAGCRHVGQVTGGQRHPGCVAEVVPGCRKGVVLGSGELGHAAPPPWRFGQEEVRKKRNG